jgi:tRNA threonylcarbamoyladenosine biosynthesis protein TsaE
MRQLARTPEDMLDLGAALARSLPAPAAGHASAYLQGDLGAGKTTLARGVLQALGHAGSARSPTYTLIEPYELPPLTVVHADLYRLGDPAELEGLALRELARPFHLWLIEWPERGGAALALPDLHVTLDVTAAGHTAQFHAHTPFGVQWLEALAAQPGRGRQG